MARTVEARVRPWETVVPPDERAIYAQAGYDCRQPWGHHPAVLVVDVTEAFVGTKPQDIRQAIQEHPNNCGQAAWDALPAIARLLEAGRRGGLPVVYTRGQPAAIATKRHRRAKEDPTANQRFPALITPREGDRVLEKPRASAFFGTDLADWLRARGVDCLLVAGTSTSGCVRASVVDGFSHGFTVFVVEECTFDRSAFFHAATLFDVNAKYADVVTLEEALEYLAGLKQPVRVS